MRVAREAHRGVRQNNSAEIESAEFSVLLDHLCQLLIVTTFSWLLIHYFFWIVFANLVLTTAGTANIVEPYLWYTLGRAGGSRFSHIASRFQEHFHKTKTPPSNAVIISFVETFLRSGTVVF